jgi:hypothetical protein
MFSLIKAKCRSKYVGNNTVKIKVSYNPLAH